MVYRKSIPVATEKPSVSQPKIKENFTQLNDQFEVDHTALEESTNLGKHKKVTLYEQAADPSTAENEIALYSKESSDGTQMYYREEQDGEVHPLSSFIKAIVNFDVNGQIIGDAFNVSSVAKLGTGQFKVNFASNLPDTNYSVSTGYDSGTGLTGRARSIEVNNRAINFCHVITMASSADDTRLNVSKVNIIIYRV